MEAQEQNWRLQCGLVSLGSQLGEKKDAEASAGEE